MEKDHVSAEELLKRISDVVSSLDDLQQVMDEIVGMTTSLLKVGNCSLVMLDETGETMTIRAATGLSQEVVRTFRQRVGEGISGWVAKTGKPLLVEDVESHPLFKRRSSGRYSTKSLLSVPLLREKRILGVLNVNNKSDNTIFTKSDEMLLSVLANFIVIALEKADMRRKLRVSERYEADLRVAREIQEGLLPAEMPFNANWSLAARNVPARSVAGDFFDVIPLPDDRTCVILGDVCGKGVPAALYMARVLGYYRAVAQVRSSAEEIMAFVNDLLAAEWSERTFVTATMCVFDNTTGRISFCSAGHPVPYVLHETAGAVEPVPMGHGLPLGIESAVPFERVDVEAAPGDTFVLYTDGITEAKNPQEEMFRDERMCEVMRAHRGSADELARKIIEAVEQFSGPDNQSDDITLVVIKRA